MTHDDAVEAARLLLAAGVPQEQINYDVLIVANFFTKEMNRRLAQAVIKQFFPEWKDKTHINVV